MWYSSGVKRDTRLVEHTRYAKAPELFWHWLYPSRRLAWSEHAISAPLGETAKILTQETGDTNQATQTNSATQSAVYTCFGGVLSVDWMGCRLPKGRNVLGNCCAAWPVRTALDASYSSSIVVILISSSGLQPPVCERQSRAIHQTRDARPRRLLRGKADGHLRRSGVPAVYELLEAGERGQRGHSQRFT